MERIANTAIMFSEKPLFGKENRDNIGLYVECIARHNMWFASDDTKQTYKDYGLDELIPKPDNSHRISFSKQPLLFLLCLLDTLEPLKAYKSVRVGDDTILESIILDVLKCGESYSLVITDSLGDKILTRAQDLDTWLDVSLHKTHPNMWTIVMHGSST